MNRFLVSIACAVSIFGGTAIAAMPASAAPGGSCGVGPDVKAANQFLKTADTNLGQFFHDAGGNPALGTGSDDGIQADHDFIKTTCQS